jgi:hypothetical protein
MTSCPGQKVSLQLQNHVFNRKILFLIDKDRNNHLFMLNYKEAGG